MRLAQVYLVGLKWLSAVGVLLLSATFSNRQTHKQKVHYHFAFWQLATMNAFACFLEELRCFLVKESRRKDNRLSCLKRIPLPVHSVHSQNLFTLTEENSGRDSNANIMVLKLINSSDDF